MGVFWAVCTLVKYNRNFYLYSFLGTHLLQYMVTPVNGFSRMIAQTTGTCTRMCFLGFVHMAPHLGGQNLNETPNF